ncbi:hypothetical protein ACOMHN_010326 [Nucella lapillus]
MPEAALVFRVRCGSFHPVYLSFMAKRARRKVAMRNYVITLRTRLTGVMAGLVLSVFFYSDLILRCGDVELNPGPTKPGSSLRQDMDVLSEMPRRIVSLPFLVLLLLCLLCLLHPACSQFRRVCYFTNWSRDLQEAEARFRLSDVEPHLCTHLVYAFAAVQRHNSSLAPIVTQQMEGQGEELLRYREFNALKEVNVDLKTLLGVGGSVQTNEDFVQIVSSESSRKQFANNVLLHLRTWGFDGLDIDWEYPGDPPETKLNFVLLLREIRRTFAEEAEKRKASPLLLSVAAPVSQAPMTAGYDIPQVSSLVDFINLMAYDFHGSWNSLASFNSPLYARLGDPRFSPELSVNWAVQQWLKKGAEPGKLVLGIAGYGQSFTLVDPDQHGVGAPTQSSGTAGPYRHMSGQLAYYEVCEVMRAGGIEVWDDLQRVPYVYLGNQWVGYDNPRSIKDKVDFAVQHSLGGVMLWSLDMDDFRGAFCSKGRYPLLTAMVTAIGDNFPEVSVKIHDTATWAHPEGKMTPLPTTPPTQPATTPTTPTTFPVSSSTAVPSDRPTQKVVVLQKAESHAALRVSCRLLLLSSALVWLGVFVYWFG